MTDHTCSYEGHKNKKAIYQIDDEWYCQACYRRYKRNGTLKPKDLYRPPMTEERLLSRREINGEDCWLFTPEPDQGESIDSYGYARWYESDRYQRGEQPLVYAHRWAYEYWKKEEIPADKVPDHICHDPGVCNLSTECPHRRCFNPDHLQVISPGENIRLGAGPAARNARRTGCDKGHPYVNPDGSKNFWRSKSGKRMCKDCYGPGLGRGSHNRLKQTCAAGHEYTKDNTYVDPQGNRHCRKCRNKAVSDNYWKNKKVR